MPINTELIGTETKLVRWKKVLQVVQNIPGAKTRNNPKPFDTLRETLVKLLRALNGV